MRLFTIILALLIAMISFEASTCTCGPLPSARDALQKMKAVFEGTVLDVKRQGWGNKEVKFKVTKNYKGVENMPEVTVYTAGISASCGFQFDTGKAYMVFAYANNNGTLQTGLCTRTKEIVAGGWRK